MSATPWFKLYPGDFLNGLIGLEPDEIAVYTVALLMIYDGGGPIRDLKVLAQRCGIRPTRCEKVVQRLVAMGKLTASPAGVTNGRAEKELENRRNLSEKSAKSSQARWEKRAEKPNENNKAPMRTQCDRIENAYPYQKPEARSQILGTEKGTSTVTGEEEDDDPFGPLTNWRGALQ